MSTAPSVASGLSFAASTQARASASDEAVDRVDVDLGDGVGVGRRPRSSMSTPPWAQSMPRCFLAERSRVKLA